MKSRRSKWRVEVAIAIAVGAWIGIAPARVTADCTLSDVVWDGDAVRVRVSDGVETRDARVDVTSGAVTAVDVRVRDAVYCEARKSILFRDVLGIFEVEASGGQGPTLRMPAPDGGRHFLRAFGADERGRLLAWTYDRDAGRHALWTAGEAGAAPKSREFHSGPDALAEWTRINRSVAFPRAGARFVRTACVRFGERTERVCVEPTGQGADGRARFQLVSGQAGAMGEWARDVVPTGFAATRDSSAVVIGLDETKTPGTARTTTWLATAERARRIAESPAPPAFESRVHWLGSGDALWVDAAGALWRIDLTVGSATPIVTVTAPKRAAVYHRVIVATKASADSAEAVRAKLAAAGHECGVRRATGGWEVQAGAAAARPEAEARAATLRGLGFTPRVETGDAATIAPGITFAAATATGGKRAYLRNAATAVGVGSELWLQDGKTPARRVWAPGGGRAGD